LIYNGKSGLSLRPLRLPESLSPHLSRQNIGPTISHLGHFGRTFTSFAQLSLLSLYHYHAGHTSVDSSHWLSSATFAEFARRHNLRESFRRDAVEPVLANVVTCPPDELDIYPAAEIVRYIAQVFGRNQWVVKGGVQRAADRLLTDIPDERRRLGTTLTALRRVAEFENNSRADSCASPHSKEGSVSSRKSSTTTEPTSSTSPLELETSSGATERFDIVIFATQANQAHTLLQTHYESLKSQGASTASLAAAQRRLDLLATFPYTYNVVMNHTDAKAVMPAHRGDWQSLNLATWQPPRSPRASTAETKQDAEVDEKKGLSDDDWQHGIRFSRKWHMATQDFTRIDPTIRVGTEPLLQTTNPTVAIDPAKVVSVARFERALVTVDSRAALARFLGEEHGNRQQRWGVRERIFGTKCGKAKARNEAAEAAEVAPVQGADNIYFVGAWAAEGIPFLEGCVVSAERVAKTILQNS
jgi:hypothetical protein